MLGKIKDFLKYLLVPANRSFRPSVSPGSTDDFRVNVGDRLFFPHQSDQLLDAESAETLLRQQSWITRYGRSILIEGHCAENEGTREGCLNLSARRAGHVRMRLQAMGVSPDRMRTIAYGRERPVNLGEDETDRAMNRRAVIVLE